MNKKELLITKTYALFAEKGYSLSLSEVASALDMKKQSIYNYFSNKDELISEMLQYVSVRYHSNLKSHINSTKNLDTKERLLSILSYIVNFFSNSTHLRLRRWISLDLSKEKQDIINSYEADIKKCIEEIISEGVKNGDIQSKDIEFMSNFFIIIIRGIVDEIFITDAKFKHQQTLETIFNEYWAIVGTSHSHPK